MSDDLRARIIALANLWDEQRSHYPTTTDPMAVAADAAVKLCAQELRALVGALPLRGADADSEQVEQEPNGTEGEEHTGGEGVVTSHATDSTPHRFGFGPCSCMSCGR